MGYFLGISGGHSKSTAIAIKDGSVVGAVNGPPVNLHTFPQPMIVQRLGEILKALVVRLGLNSTRELREKTCKLALALPGAAKQSDQSYAADILKNQMLWVPGTFLVADDTWAGLIAGVLGSRGICAIAGTGASVFVGLGTFPNDKTHKIDGFGPILGDFGSGFQLVVDVFREMGRSYDRQQQQLFPLFQEILSHELFKYGPEIPEIPELQGWFDGLYMSYAPEWRILFANLASAVTSAADRRPKPDRDAVRFVKRAARQMAESIEIALERYHSEVTSLPIVFQGGMFENSNLYRQTVIQTLRKRYPNEARMGAFKMVVGAGFMACAREGLVPETGVIEAITSSIASISPSERALLVNPVS